MTSNIKDYVVNEVCKIKKENDALKKIIKRKTDIGIIQLKHRIVYNNSAYSCSLCGSFSSYFRCMICFGNFCFDCKIIIQEKRKKTIPYFLVCSLNDEETTYVCYECDDLITRIAK